MMDPNSNPNSSPKNRHVPSMPRKAVNREQLIELIRARVESELHLGDAHVAIPIPIQRNDGGPNWKIDMVVGIPSDAWNDYMTIVRALMEEYELR